MEEAEFMTYTEIIHQGEIKMILLHGGVAIMLTVLVCQLQTEIKCLGSVTTEHKGLNEADSCHVVLK